MVYLDTQINIYSLIYLKINGVFRLYFIRLGGLYQITQGTQIGFYNKRWDVKSKYNAGVDMSMVPQ